VPTTYDVAFRSSLPGADSHYRGQMPGRPLAGALSEALTQQGVLVGAIVDNEPFWSLPLPQLGSRAEAFLAPMIPDVDASEAIWHVSIDSKLGFFDRILGKQEDPLVRRIVHSLHAALRSMPHIRNIYWSVNGAPGGPDASNGFRSPPL
jgi:hypothetical protein